MLNDRLPFFPTRYPARYRDYFWLQENLAICLQVGLVEESSETHHKRRCERKCCRNQEDVHHTGIDSLGKHRSAPWAYWKINQQYRNCPEGEGADEKELWNSFLN